MKRIHRFLNSEPPGKGLGLIFGGAKPRETTFDGQCDIHHDDNDNGTVDPGECVDIVECENTK